MTGFHVMGPPFSVNIVQQQQQQSLKKVEVTEELTQQPKLASVPLAVSCAAACGLGEICPATRSGGAL